MLSPLKNTSTIDYSICSTKSLKIVADFDIKELDALYSDGHSLLNTTLKFRNLVIENPLQTKETPKQQRKWQPNKRYEFAFNLDDVKIDEIWLNLQKAHEDTPSVNKEVMNDFSKKMEIFFLDPGKNLSKMNILRPSAIIMSVGLKGSVSRLDGNTI